MLLTGCFPRNAPLEPKVRYVPKTRDLAALHSPFPPLTEAEQREEWARELRIGKAFARELDLYRAITSYKRAVVLLPSGMESRRREIEYHIVLCYFLGDRYQDAIRAVEGSSVAYATRDFPAYHDLLLILYESYLQTDQLAMAGLIYRKLHEADPEAGDQVALSSALIHGDMPCLVRLNNSHHPSGLSDLLSQYCRCRKSVGKAECLNALLPGLGYLYLGQKQSAITAALLNGLFIFGTYQFFARGLWPAGIFTGSLELGWYFGGIYGAGEAAHFYNERLYQRLAGSYLREKRLFPIMMLRFSF